MGPVVTIHASNTGDMGLIPGRGTKIPHTTWPKNLKIKKKKEISGGFKGEHILNMP